MRKPINPYESGDSIKTAMALYTFAMNSDAVLYIGEMQESLREFQHDFYLIDGQSVILLLPEMCPIDVEFTLEISKDEEAN